MAGSMIGRFLRALTAGALVSVALALGGCDWVGEKNVEDMSPPADQANPPPADLAVAPGDGPAVDAAQPPDLAPPPAQVFAMSVEVRAPTGAAMATYIQAIDRSMFDGRRIDNKAALEYQGIGRLLAMGGSVFIGPRTEPTLQKFTVGNDLKLTMAASVSVMAFGASFVDIGFIPGISPTKSYYLAGPTQKAVLLDPTDMTIKGSFDISGSQRMGFEGSALHQGIIQFEHAVVGKRAFESTLHSASNPSRFYPNMTVTVYDTENDKLLKVIEDDRCYGPSTMVKAENGDVYVSSYSFTGRIYQTMGYDYKPTCILRIKAGTDDFDRDFIVKFRDLLNGKECPRWYPVNGRYSYCTAIELADLKGAANTSNAVGEIWKIDIEKRTASKVPGLPNTTPFITLGYPDGNQALMLGVAAVPGQFDRSIVYRLVPADDSVTKAFEVDGLFRGFWPVR